MTKVANKTKQATEWNPTKVDSAYLALFDDPAERKLALARLMEGNAEAEKQAGEVIGLRRPISKDGVPGLPYKDETNVILNLRYFFTGEKEKKLRYNEFARQIEIDGHPLEDADIMRIVYFMQTEGRLPGIHKGIVYSAIQSYAFENIYNEPIDWLDSLTWDGAPRVDTWLTQSTGVDDCEYHRSVGVQWFVNGLVRRLYNPGCVWDYVLVLVGGQGVGKTSLFRIIGGKWYKCFTGNVDNKDFYIKCRGASILDLDEGATLSKSDSIKIKAIITETHDEYRAPYDATTKCYPRQFVFSMSTNNDEPFKDNTGNRRYWTVDIGNKKINFAWLEENREQMYAEAIYKIKNKIPLPEVPLSDAEERQEAHRTEDPWTDDIMEHLKNKNEATVRDIYVDAISKQDKTTKPGLDRFDKFVQMRISEVLKKNGFIKERRGRGESRKTVWVRKEKINIEDDINW